MAQDPQESELWLNALDAVLSQHGHTTAEASQILPWLFLGGKAAAEDAFSRRNEMRITHILNFCEPWCAMGDNARSFFFPETETPTTTEGSESNGGCPEKIENPFYHGVEAEDANEYPLLQKHYHRDVKPMMQRVRFAWEKWNRTANADSRRNGVKIVEISAEESETGEAETRREMEPRLLVHCAMGVNRSATIVVAYLVEAISGYPLLKAADHVRKSRGFICSNTGFRKELVRFAMEIAADEEHLIAEKALDPIAKRDEWLEKYEELAENRRQTQKEEDEYNHRYRCNLPPPPPHWWLFPEDGIHEKLSKIPIQIDTPVRVRICGDDWADGVVVRIEKWGNEDEMAAVLLETGEEDYYSLNGPEICGIPEEELVGR